MKSRSKPFTGARYATRGVVTELALDIQIILWGLIDAMRDSGEELDYLQTFELTVRQNAAGETIQLIIHRQERPAFVDATVLRNISTPFNGRIWVIDDETHATMLLPEEY